MNASMQRTRSAADAGFTLVEVVVAMLVLTVAVLALIPVQTRALATVVLSDERQQANAYASGAIENVRARALVPASTAPAAASGFSTIAAQTDPVLATQSATSKGITFTTTVSVTDPVPASDPQLVTVTAATTWTSRSSTAGVRQVTVRTKIAAPGDS